ncbi:MAG TPA: nucleotidyltransferase domain-containing protein [Ktedonosporobacter sp.]|nr:nucleotidyltransferase domain-containing protein [Ktedonosporobacter sp.]
MQPEIRRIAPWLDDETSNLVNDKVKLLIERHPDVLAVILYGSVARHEERSIDEPDPSDVDLLAVFNTDDRQDIRSQTLALVHTMGLAEDQHLRAPREVNVMFATRNSREWDPEFVENVRRDGIVLYQRGELPEVFAA